MRLTWKQRLAHGITAAAVTFPLTAMASVVTGWPAPWSVVEAQGAVGQSTSTSTPTTSAPVLTEVQRLKAENLRLRFALWQQENQRIQDAGRALDVERQTLETEFRSTLKASPEQTFNWQTFSFVNPVTPPKSGGGQ